MENEVCIPLDIIRNTKLSTRARLIWAELSLLPKGAVGEFVVKPKELSKLLGICDSTLRRAVKALEEAGLIQCVGLFEKKFKKYVFKNSSPALEENPPTPFFQGGINPKTNGGLLNSHLENTLKGTRGGRGILSMSEPAPYPITPFSNWQQKYQELKAQMKSEPTQKPEQKVDPSETHLLRMKYPFVNGIPTRDDKSKIVYAKHLYGFNKDQWRAQFPLLNGLDNRPLLDADLIEYIIMKEPANVAGEKMMDIVDKELQRFTDFPIDRA